MAVRDPAPNTPTPSPTASPKDSELGRTPPDLPLATFPGGLGLGVRAEVLTDREDSGPVGRPPPGPGLARSRPSRDQPLTLLQRPRHKPRLPRGLKNPKCWTSGWGRLRPAHRGLGPGCPPPGGPAPAFLMAPGSAKPSLFPLSTQRLFLCHPLGGHFPGWRHWPRSLWRPRH